MLYRCNTGHVSVHNRYHTGILLFVIQQCVKRERNLFYCHAHRSVSKHVVFNVVSIRYYTVPMQYRSCTGTYRYCTDTVPVFPYFVFYCDSRDSEPKDASFDVVSIRYYTVPM